jgi:hypothetical protein
LKGKKVNKSGVAEKSLRKGGGAYLTAEEKRRSLLVVKEYKS